MDTDVNYTIVGGFVVALLVGIIIAILWLSSGLNIERFKIYKVNMQESVSGLSVDATVEFNGVNVGTVKDIAISKKNPCLVELLLRIEADAPVSKGTTASLASRGITGIAYIALKDKGTDTSPLIAEKGEQYPVIPTIPSLFLRLDTALGKLTKSLTELSTSMSSLMDKENQRAFKNILLNTNEITHTLAENSEKLNTILANAVIASQQFSPLLQSSRGTIHVLETQTLPSLNQAMTNLNYISQNLLDVSNVMKQNPSVLIRGTEPQHLGPGEK